MPRISIEEIRRVRDVHGERVGIARLDREALKALKAGAPPEKVAKVTSAWILRDISLEEALILLRELAKGRDEG